MLKLEEITTNAALTGIEPGQVVRVVTTEPVGDNALTVYYKTSDGDLRERMLFRTDEATLALAEAGRPWAFDAPGAAFKLAAEAYRITLAHLFDPMMAVHTANVEPLPHQITAVYESMLPRQPLRYVLADDPGAGKTIMAGLFISELLLRADARRVLIVAPGSLIEQWQDEMSEKFGLFFTPFSRDLVEQSHSGNPFDEIDLLLVRLDQLARSDDLQTKLCLTRWDLVVVDEAHKLSATYFGNRLNKTRRFELGERLGEITRHFLLMTATPHNGKEADFQLFLSLLDADRFYGRPRHGVHTVDVSDVMRRMVKEDLLKFDGTPLFPERRATTVNYKLSDPEAALYTAVTNYVTEEWQKADTLADNKRKGTVGFALTTLQRRLASSPEAIYQSLRRRHQRLKRRVDEEKLRQRGTAVLAETFGGAIPEDADDLTAEEQEQLEEQVVDQATAAQTDAGTRRGNPYPAKPRGASTAGCPEWPGSQVGRTLPIAAAHARDAGGLGTAAQADRLLRAPRHTALSAAADRRVARRSCGHRHHPWGRHTRGSPECPGALPQRPCHTRAHCHGCGRRRHQPPERQPHGQL